MNDAGKKKYQKTKLIGLVLMVVAVASVFLLKRNREVEEPPMPIRPLKTLVVGTTDPGIAWKYAGRTGSAKRATLTFEVSGTVKELKVKEGDQVESGQVLVLLDDRDYRNALSSAQAELDRAEAQLERITLAAKSNAVSKQEVSNAQAAFDKAQAELDIRKKAVEDTELTARFDGTVSRTYVQRFENIQAKEPILDLQNLTEVEIKASIPEARLALVDPAKREPSASTKKFYATFDYFPERQFPLSVKEFSTEADPDTQTFTATFIMEAPEDVMILPGMSAMVYEKAEADLKASGGALVVPLDAVPVDGLGQYFVWVLEEEEEDGIFAAKRRDVTVGEMTGKNILVASGLARGDRIAAAGVHILQENQKVRLLASDN